MARDQRGELVAFAEQHTNIGRGRYSQIQISADAVSGSVHEGCSRAERDHAGHADTPMPAAHPAAAPPTQVRTGAAVPLLVPGTQRARRSAPPNTPWLETS